MNHAIFCGIVHRQKTRRFFAKLAGSASSSMYDCRHNRARIYHPHQKAVARHNYVHGNSLTFTQLLAGLQAMREGFRTVAALRSALSTRGNLLLELLAPHHQLGVPRTDSGSHQDVAFERARMAARSRPEAAGLSGGALGAGEREAIALATEPSADVLLIGRSEGRQEAMRLVSCV